MSFQQIGSDGGLLERPVTLDQVILAPAERADIVVDFSGHRGETITLQNWGPDGPAMNLPPIPPDGRTTGQVMQFRVGKGRCKDQQPSSRQIEQDPAADDQAAGKGSTPWWKAPTSTGG